jgi:hypothetical protein
MTGLSLEQMDQLFGLPKIAGKHIETAEKKETDASQ